MVLPPPYVRQLQYSKHIFFSSCAFILLICALVGVFLKIFYISQGSVATYLRCGGIFNDSFTAHFLQSISEQILKKDEN